MSVTSDKGHQSHAEHASNADVTDGDYAYRAGWRAWAIAAAMGFLYLAQVAYVTAAGFWVRAVAGDVGGLAIGLWLSQSFQVVSAVLGPAMSNTGDYIGRRYIVVGGALCGMVGCFVAGSANTMGQAIAGSTIFGLSWASLGTQFSIAAEIIPRRHRGTAALIVCNLGNLGVPLGALGTAGLINARPGGYAGWRSAFWLFGAMHALSAILTFLVYNPPRVRLVTNVTRWQLIYKATDPVGLLLLGVGLTMTLMALIWGHSNVYTWKDPTVIGLISAGLVVLAALVLYEMYVNKEGLLHHDLFKSRNMPIALFCIFVEGMIYICLNYFYSPMTAALYEARPLSLGLRFSVFIIGACSMACVNAYIAWRYKVLKPQLLFGFAMFTAAVIGLATTTLNSSKQMIVIWMAGTGFAAPIQLYTAVAQFAVSPEHVGLASALTLTFRATGGAVGTAIVDAVFKEKSVAFVARNVRDAGVQGGLQEPALTQFIAAISANNATRASTVPGVTSQLVAAGALGRRAALLNAYHYCWYMLIPFLVVAFVGTACLSSVKHQMTGHIDRPVDAKEGTTSPVTGEKSSDEA